MTEYQLVEIANKRIVSEEKKQRFMHLAQQANTYKNNAKASKTYRDYERDWIQFSEWCREWEFSALPSKPEIIQIYIAELAEKGYKFSTIDKKLTSITYYHKENGFVCPVNDSSVKEQLSGLKNISKYTPQGKEPLMLNDLHFIIKNIKLDSMKGYRDRALLLLAFFGAFRRSEISSLETKHVKFFNWGIEVNFYETKTKMYKTKIISRRNNFDCPVKALEDWVAMANISQGHLFYSLSKNGKILRPLGDKSVNRVIKEYIGELGHDPDDFGAHSLRSGFATSAAEYGYSDQQIMQVTGHKRRETLDIYVKKGKMRRNNATLMGVKENEGE